MDTEGKHQRRITPVPLGAGPMPDVSPDGKQIIFYHHQDSPHQNSIFKINLDGTHLTRLTGPDHFASFSAFSPDGRKILFMSDRLSAPAFDTFIMDPDGSNKQLLIEGAYDPVWAVQVTK